LNWKLSPQRKKKKNPPKHPTSPFKEKKKEGEGEGSLLGGQWKVKDKFFSPLLTFPPTNFTKTFNFSP
jgi:hypothetical protein